MSASDIARLGRAIFDLHGVSATHMRSENVIETFEGKTAREGTVDIFTVHGHARAGFAYAWSFENDTGNREYVAVLEIPPVKSARHAVRATVAAEHVRRQS